MRVAQGLGHRGSADGRSTGWTKVNQGTMGDQRTKGTVGGEGHARASDRGKHS